MTLYRSKVTKKAIKRVMAFLLMSSLSTLTLANELQDNPSSIESKTVLYLTLEGKNSQPDTKKRTHFECSDKVYVVLESENIAKGKHSLSFRWKNPANEEQERVDYPFTVIDTKTRAWAWLNLIRSRGAGMITWINPAAGLEEFIGPWTVYAYIDDKKVADASFSVDC